MDLTRAPSTPHPAAPHPVSSPRATAALTAFLGPPTLWTAHLGISYLLVTLDCGGSWDGGRTAIAAVTAVCAAAIGALGWRAWRQWRTYRGEKRPGELPDPGSIKHFLLVGGALLAVPFTLMVVLAGMVPFFVPLCR